MILDSVNASGTPSTSSLTILLKSISPNLMLTVGFAAGVFWPFFFTHKYRKKKEETFCNIHLQVLQVGEERSNYTSVTLLWKELNNAREKKQRTKQDIFSLKSEF